MAELADAPDLGSGARKGVGVRVSLCALAIIRFKKKKEDKITKYEI